MTTNWFNERTFCNWTSLSEQFFTVNPSLCVSPPPYSVSTYLWHSFNRLSRFCHHWDWHYNIAAKVPADTEKVSALCFNLSEGFNEAITCQSCCNFAVLPIFSDYQIVVYSLLRFILLELLGNRRGWRQVALYFVDWMIRRRQWMLWFMLICKNKAENWWVERAEFILLVVIRQINNFY